jgi:hypothetical protein
MTLGDHGTERSIDISDNRFHGFMLPQDLITFSKNLPGLPPSHPAPACEDGSVPEGQPAGVYF